MFEIDMPSALQLNTCGDLDFGTDPLHAAQTTIGGREVG